MLMLQKMFPGKLPPTWPPLWDIAYKRRCWLCRVYRTIGTVSVMWDPIKKKKWKHKTKALFLFMGFVVNMSRHLRTLKHVGMAAVTWELICAHNIHEAARSLRQLDSCITPNLWICYIVRFHFQGHISECQYWPGTTSATEPSTSIIYCPNSACV